MSRVFYSDYVNHCMRFYARHDKPKFHSEADKHNWAACDNALKTFSDKERETLLTIYRSGDIIADNIYQLSRERGVSQDSIWKLVNELERKIAKRRGLL